MLSVVIVEASIYAYGTLRLDHLGSCGKWCSGEIEIENDSNRPVIMLAKASKAAMHCILASTIRLPFLRRSQWVGMVKNSPLRRRLHSKQGRPAQISNPTKAAAQPRSWLVDEISILAKHQNGTEVLGMIIVTEEPWIFD